MDPFAAWSTRLRASDAHACTEVFDALHPSLLRYALRLTQDEDAAYDVVQEAFITLWERRHTLDPNRSLKALLYRIVHNRSLNHLRMKKHAATRTDALAQQPPASVPSPEETYETAHLSVLLRTWIDELAPRRREAFQLSRFEGLSHDEIAQVMNLTPRTVTNHIMLALQHLRNRLRTFEANGA